MLEGTVRKSRELRERTADDFSQQQHAGNDQERSQATHTVSLGQREGRTGPLLDRSV